jgi:hypothetical protein
MSDNMKPSRHDIDAELREILASDDTNQSEADTADMLIAHRQRISRQLDVQSFARQRKIRVQRRSWFAQPSMWLAGAGSAVAVVLILVTTSPTNQPSNDSARRVDSHSVVTTDDARMSQSDADLTEVDALVSETLASVDEVWDRGEVDIDRLLTDGSRK